MLSPVSFHCCLAHLEHLLCQHRLGAALVCSAGAVLALRESHLGLWVSIGKVSPVFCWHCPCPLPKGAVPRAHESTAGVPLVLGLPWDQLLPWSWDKGSSETLCLLPKSPFSPGGQCRNVQGKNVSCKGWEACVPAPRALCPVCGHGKAVSCGVMRAPGRKLCLVRGEISKTQKSGSCCQGLVP